MKALGIRILSNGTVYVACIMLSNIVNFVYNAYLGRVLSFENYATITIVNTCYYFLSLFILSLGNTVNHKSAMLVTEKGKSAAYAFFTSIRRQVSFIGGVGAVVLLISSGWLSHFFKVDDPFVFLFFTPLLFVGMYSAMARGYLQGNLLFAVVAVTNFFEALVKLMSAVILTSLGLGHWAYISIPISLMSAFLVLSFLMWKYKAPLNGAPISRKDITFPKKFYLASIFNGLAITAFLSIDVMLAKHFLSAAHAGEYAVLSLVGKMIYFFGSLFNAFMVTFTSRDMGKHKHTGRTFIIVFGVCALFTTCAFLALGPFGRVTVPFLLGQKSIAIVPYLTAYCLSISLFTLSTTIVNYRLARHEYVFSAVAFLNSIFVSIGISWSHGSVGDIAWVMMMSGIIGFGVIFVLHILYGQGKFVKRAFDDFLDLFSSKNPDNQATYTHGKRILVFNWRDTKHKYAGGAEVYIHELAKRWVASGNQVTVFCGSDGHSPRYEVVDGVHIVRRGGFYFVYIWAFLYYLVKFRGRYDVIVDCENGIPFFTPLYAREKQFLVIHHVHQDVFRKSLVPPFSHVAQFLETSLMPLIYQNVRVITVSPSSKKEILEYELTQHEIEIIYNGVDVDYFVPGEKSEHPTILYLGRLKKYKSVDVLIRAAQKIFDALPDAELLIAGDGEEYLRLQKLAATLGIADKIRFLGRVTEEMKAELYRTSWVFVNPSYMEGWGITTIEANACGTPVVASNVSGLIDSVKNPHTGFLVPYGDVDEFADRILTLLTDVELRAKMSEEAVTWAGEFTWDKSATKALNIFFAGQSNIA